MIMDTTYHVCGECMWNDECNFAFDDEMYDCEFQSVTDDVSLAAEEEYRMDLDMRQALAMEMYNEYSDDDYIIY